MAEVMKDMHCLSGMCLGKFMVCIWIPNEFCCTSVYLHVVGRNSSSNSISHSSSSSSSSRRSSSRYYSYYYDSCYLTVFSLTCWFIHLLMHVCVPVFNFPKTNFLFHHFALGGRPRWYFWGLQSDMHTEINLLSNFEASRHRKGKVWDMENHGFAWNKNRGFYINHVFCESWLEDTSESRSRNGFGKVLEAS